MSVFPLLGIDYQAVLSAKIDDKDENPVSFGGDEEPKKIASSDFSALWFKLGGGMDFAITEKLYLRCEALYGIRLANTFETDTKDMVDKAVKNMKDNDPEIKSDVKTLLGHGLTVKLAVGYRF
jgi:hypothetical protein